MTKAEFEEKVENALDFIRNDQELEEQDLDPEDWLQEFELLLDSEMTR